MANTKLKKKKKGVIGANGLNNDAGRNDKLVTSFGCYNLSAERVDQILIICVW